MPWPSRRASDDPPAATERPFRGDDMSGSGWDGLWVGVGLLCGLFAVADALKDGLFRLARGMERAARKEPVDGKREPAS